MPLLDATGVIAAPTPAPGTIVVAGDTAPADALAQVEGAPLVVIAFSGMNDGRGFSLARALREGGFAGRLHARGELIPDQLAYLLRCGFDAVEISADRLARQPADQWQAAAGHFTRNYQGAHSIFDRRRAARS